MAHVRSLECVKMFLKEPFKILIYICHSYNTHWKPAFSVLQNILKMPAPSCRMQMLKLC